MAGSRELNQVAVYTSPQTGVAEHVSADGTSQSASSLLGGIIGDVQTLVRNEIALARQEASEELHKVKTASIALASAGAVLALGGLLLLLALAKGVSALANWPEWAGYATVGGVFALIGAILLASGLKKIKRVHPIPEKTAETMKENVEWLKERTSKK